MAKDCDVTIDCEGSVFVVRPVSDTGKWWIAENVEAEDWQHFAGGICVDRHCVGELYKGMKLAGLNVSTAFCVF